MSVRWSSENVVAEHRDLQATTMAVDWRGELTLLAGRRSLALISLDKPTEVVERVNRTQQKYDVTAAEWNPTQERGNMFALTCGERAELSERTGNSISSIASLRAHTRTITDLNWHQKDPNLLATCSIDTFVHIWDTRDTRKPATSLSTVAGASQVKWNKVNPNLIASGHDCDIRLWDHRKSSQPTYIAAHLSKIQGLDWSPHHENHIVTSSSDCTVKFFDISNPRRPENSITTRSPVWRARYTPFGEGIITIIVPQLRRGENSLLLWSVTDVSSPVHTFVGHSDVVLEFEWRKRQTTDQHQDFQLVTWARDHSLRIWKIDQNLQKLCGYHCEEDVLLPLGPDVELSTESALLPEVKADGQEEVENEVVTEDHFGEQEIITSQTIVEAPTEEAVVNGNGTLTTETIEKDELKSPSPQPSNMSSGEETPVGTTTVTSSATGSGQVAAGVSSSLGTVPSQPMSLQQEFSLLNTSLESGQVNSVEVTAHEEEVADSIGLEDLQTATVTPRVVPNTVEAVQSVSVLRQSDKSPEYDKFNDTNVACTIISTTKPDVENDYPNIILAPGQPTTELIISDVKNFSNKSFVMGSESNCDVKVEEETVVDDEQSYNIPVISVHTLEGHPEKSHGKSLQPEISHSDNVLPHPVDQVLSSVKIEVVDQQPACNEFGLSLQPVITLVKECPETVDLLPSSKILSINEIQDEFGEETLISNDDTVPSENIKNLSSCVSSSEIVETCDDIQLTSGSHSVFKLVSRNMNTSIIVIEGPTVLEGIESTPIHAKVVYMLDVVWKDKSGEEECARLAPHFLEVGLIAVGENVIVLDGQGFLVNVEMLVSEEETQITISDIGQSLSAYEEKGTNIVIISNDWSKLAQSLRQQLYRNAPHSTEPGVYHCDKCDRTYNARSSLNSHKVTHNGEKLYKCDECNKSFYFSTPLQIHKRIHSDERPYSCTICCASFRSRGNLRCHQRLHQKEEQLRDVEAQWGNRVECSSDAPHNVRRKQKGSKLKEHTCGECPRSFKSHVALREHAKTFHGAHELEVAKRVSQMDEAVDSPTTNKLQRLSDFKHQCGICHHYSCSKSQMHNHLQIHAAVRRWKCRYCQVRFFFRYELAQHVRTDHPGKSQNFCQSCNAVFNTCRELMSHNCRSIKGNYPCLHCKWSTDVRLRLFKHIVTEHPEDKTPYHCEFCEHSYSEPSRLRYHQKREHPEKIMALTMQRDCMRGNSEDCGSEEHSGSLDSEGMDASASGFDISQIKMVVDGDTIVYNLPETLRKDDGFQNILKFKCFYCDSKFALKNTMTRHILRKHPGKKAFKCLQCDVFFVSAVQSKNHFRKYHKFASTGGRDPRRNEKEQKKREKYIEELLKKGDKMTIAKYKFKCRYCPMAYMEKRPLVVHYSKKHPKDEWDVHPDKPMKVVKRKQRVLIFYHCKFDECDRSFDDMNLMKEHLQNAHSVPSNKCEEFTEERTVTTTVRRGRLPRNALSKNEQKVESRSRRRRRRRRREEFQDDEEDIDNPESLSDDSNEEDEFDTIMKHSVKMRGIKKRGCHANIVDIKKKVHEGDIETDNDDWQDSDTQNDENSVNENLSGEVKIKKEPEHQSQGDLDGTLEPSLLVKAVYQNRSSKEGDYDNHKKVNIKRINNTDISPKYRKKMVKESEDIVSKKDVRRMLYRCHNCSVSFTTKSSYREHRAKYRGQDCSAYASSVPKDGLLSDDNSEDSDFHLSDSDASYHPAYEQMEEDSAQESREKERGNKGKKNNNTEDSQETNISVREVAHFHDQDTPSLITFNITNLGRVSPEVTKSEENEQIFDVEYGLDSAPKRGKRLQVAKRKEVKKESTNKYEPINKVKSPVNKSERRKTENNSTNNQVRSSRSLETLQCLECEISFQTRAEFSFHKRMEH